MRRSTEEILIGVWAEVLEPGDINAHADFFDLGGDSLAAMRIVARVRVACGIDITQDQLFEHSTPATLAALIDERAGT